MRTCILTVVALLMTAAMHAQYNLIPQPRNLTTVASDMVKPTRAVKQIYPLAANENPEAYRLEITPTDIIITANTEQGLIWAERTLAQLIDSEGYYPQVIIEDWPEFAIRAFMYDSGRNFVEVSQIEQFIDLCSEYKINTFHWHLTDKPAWRIESFSYPQLNDPQYQRIGRDAGRYYSYDDIHHIVDYARERGIMIIPEIDMPGHSDYFDATFGTSMNSKEGMQILTQCLNEFFDQFPASEMPYLHIGSDEIHINNAQEFMEWAVSLVEGAGRTPIVWHPGLEAGDKAIYQVWRDGMVSDNSDIMGRKIVDSYQGYLNYYDPIMHSAHIYLHAPCSTGHSSENNLGGILCLWNDVRIIDKSRLQIHNGLMGGLLPFAERMWVGGGPKKAFKDVLRSPSDPDMMSLMQFQDKIQYHKDNYHPELLAYWQPNDPRTSWDITLTDSTGIEIYSGKAFGDMVDLNAVCAEQGINNVHEATLKRTLTVACDTVVKCRIGFDAPARSNRISDGIALQGKWENFGRVLINGTEVLPPVWNQPGLYKYHYNTWARPEEELPYTDEQLYWTRPPVDIKLNKGENTITLTTRKHFDGQHFQIAILDLP